MAYVDGQATYGSIRQESGLPLQIAVDGGQGSRVVSFNQNGLFYWDGTTLQDVWRIWADENPFLDFRQRDGKYVRIDFSYVSGSIQAFTADTFSDLESGTGTFRKIWHVPMTIDG